jgi:hypothetical protein
MSDSSHRFSVVIHDSTDVTSLAAASSRQVEELHGSEDPNVCSKRRLKLSSSAKATRTFSSSVQNPPRKTYQDEEDAFDRLCSSMERFVCRDDDFIHQESGEVPTVTMKKEEKKKQHAVSSTPKVSSPPVEDRDVVEDRDGDILDQTFDKIEHYTCRDDTTTEPRFSQETDFLDRIFGGVEQITCNSAGKKKSEDAKKTEKAKPVVPEKKLDSKYCLDRNSSIIQVPPVEYEDDLFSDDVGPLCNGVERVICRDEFLEESTEPDLLDRIFEPKCSSVKDDNSILASKSVASAPVKKTTEDKKEKKDDRDLLDRIFENVEAHTCRPFEEESIAKAEQTVRPSQPKKKRSGSKKQPNAPKEAWAKFRVFEK